MSLRPPLAEGKISRQIPFPTSDENMTKRPPATALVVIMLVFFIFGVLTVVLSRHGHEAATSPTSSPTFIAPRRPDQQTIIVIGVDNLGRSKPVLEAIWFATYRLPAKDLFLFGMPIDLKPYGNSADQLSDLFTWDAARGIEPSFVGALQEVVPLTPNAIIVLDEQGFGRVVDYLGGIEVNGAQMDGAQVVSVVGMLRDNPTALLSTQQHFVEAMAERVADMEDHPDLTPLLSIMPDHAFLSVDVKVLVDEIAPLLPLDPTMIHIDLPWAQATASP
jgi:hypothetical protein